MSAYSTRTLLSISGACVVSALLAGCYFSTETAREQKSPSPESSSPQTDLPAILTFPWSPAEGGMAAQVYGTIGLEGGCWTVTNDELDLTWPLAVPESTVVQLDEQGMPSLNFAHGPQISVGQFLDSGGGYVSEDLFSEFSDVLTSCQDAGIDLTEIAMTYGD